MDGNIVKTDAEGCVEACCGGIPSTLSLTPERVELIRQAFHLE
jgi:hypothetical protein